MTPLSDYLRQDGVPADAAAAAQAYNDLTDHFAPIASNRVLAWMGETSQGDAVNRLEKLQAFAATTNAQASPLRGPVKTVLIGVSNPTTEIDMAPGRPHRQLLAALVAATVLTQADADALVWRGWVDGFTEATAELVTSTRAANAAADAEEARQAGYEAARNAWGLQVYGAGDAELSRRLAAGEPMPTLAELLEFVKDRLGA
jgi:hypothetical protein